MHFLERSPWSLLGCLRICQEARPRKHCRIEQNQNAGAKDLWPDSEMVTADNEPILIDRKIASNLPCASAMALHLPASMTQRCHSKSHPPSAGHNELRSPHMMVPFRMATWSSAKCIGLPRRDVNAGTFLQDRVLKILDDQQEKLEKRRWVSYLQPSS